MQLFRRLLCHLGWHTWEVHGTRRVCVDCGKRQVFIRIADEGSWEDV